MSTFNLASAFQVGDEFREEYITGIFTVLTPPQVCMNETLQRRQVSWKAENAYIGEPVDYLITEGLEHYGPKIYTDQ